MEILRYGNPVLRQKARTVDTVDKSVLELLIGMHHEMCKANGIGIAAPQVGESLQVMIASSGKDEVIPLGDFYVNPSVVWESDDDCAAEEGCLSIPGVKGVVWRPREIVLRWTTVHNAEREERFSGSLARIIQHEVDHLNGVLFVDRMAPGDRAAIAGQLRRVRLA